MLLSLSLCGAKQMEDVKRRKAPGFGNWDFYSNQLPVSHYFESAMPAASVRGHFFGGKEDDDLFKVPPVPTMAAYRHHRYHHGERKKGGEKHQKQQQGRACYVTSKAPKVADEDLYKIPPELLYQIPKRKRIHRNFWCGCLGLSCIA